MLYSFLQTVTPYKSLSIYEQYYETSKQIHAYGNRKITLKLYSNLAVHLYLAIIQLVFYFHPNMSAHHRILLVDFFWAIGLNSTFNFLLSLQASMVIYFYLAFYLDDHLYLNQTMRSVLFPKTKQDNSKWSQINGRIQSIAWKMINILQAFTLLMNCILLAGNLQCIRLYIWECKRIWDLEEALTVTLCGLLLAFSVLHLIALTLFNVALLQFAYILILLGAYIITTVAYLHLSVKSALNFLASFLEQKSRSFTWKALFSSQVDLVLILRILASADRLFGRLFLVFLLINLPCSAFMLVQVLFTKSLKGQALFLVGTFIVYEISATLVIHFFLARFSRIFQRVGPLLLRVNARNQHRVGDSCAHLRLNLLIARMHTRRPYGLTYGGLALITMATFTKCMLLYGKFFMYAYKLIN